MAARQAASSGKDTLVHTEVEFSSPRQVRLIPMPAPEPGPGEVLVSTLGSGISAGTELTAFTGTNPYLHRRWDARRRLFIDGEPTFPYPLRGWGYEEVGRVTDAGPGAGQDLTGQVVWGIWGHRSAAVLPEATARRQVLGPDVPPVCGIFARPGAVALNALLDANPRLGDTLVIFGQGVIGLLLTALAAAAGARVVAVDPNTERLTLAAKLGASVVLAEPGTVAEAVRDATGDRGAPVAVDVSGQAAALHEAIRTVGLNGLVVAAGFYQGGLGGVRLGEEFHHNRVRLVSSQIGAVNPALSASWDRDRLHHDVMERIADGRLDPTPLVSHRLPAAQCQAAYDLLTSGDPRVLQVVLDFGT
jgi:2-desacetyl-2-hydroxyethyl bacteriochlorophyllide A dehydrogenase